MLIVTTGEDSVGLFDVMRGIVVSEIYLWDISRDALDSLMTE